MPPELDRLIRAHECDNSVRFQDFARVVLRQDKQELLNAMAGYPDSCPSFPSVPPSPSSVGVRSSRAQDKRRSSKPPSENGSVRSSQAPYATGDGYPPAPTRSGRSTPSRPSTAPAESSEVRRHSRGGYSRQGDSRDLLRWDTEPNRSSTPPPQHSFRSGQQSRNDGASRGSTPPPNMRHPRENAMRGSDNMADCLAWPATREQSDPGMEDPRLGKRFYAGRAAAREILPRPETPYDSEFDGRDARFHRPPQFAAPFGTDADLRLKRPEDGGTHEYQPAYAENPRARPI